MIHELKILPEYFVEVVRGNKTFEVRKDDRPFNVGDELILYEVNCGKYTGRNIKVIITYILRNPDYCKEGYCILGFKQPVNQWISVNDRLPEIGRSVLVAVNINAKLNLPFCTDFTPEIRIGRLDDNDKWGLQFDSADRDEILY